MNELRVLKLLRIDILPGSGSAWLLVIGAIYGESECLVEGGFGLTFVNDWLVE